MTLADELAQLNPTDALSRALQIITAKDQIIATKTAALDNAESKIKALTCESAQSPNQ
jgi:hypothetical protein